MPRSPARQELARLIDHTLLKADATRRKIETLCAEARKHGLFSVCVNGSRVAQAAHLLESSDVNVTCVVGHPLGASEADVKRYETEAAIDSGAQIIEVTANLGWLKDGEDACVVRELRDVVEAADERPVSVRIETNLLTLAETERLCRLAREAEAKGVTLSAQFDPAATLDAVKKVRGILGGEFGIKADSATFEMKSIISLLDSDVTRFGMADAVSLLETL